MTTPVHFEPDFSTTPKSVAVYINAEYVGSFPNRTAACEALGLVEEPVVLIKAQEKALQKAQAQGKVRSRSPWGQFQ